MLDMAQDRRVLDRRLLDLGKAEERRSHDGRVLERRSDEKSREGGVAEASICARRSKARRLAHGRSRLPSAATRGNKSGRPATSSLGIQP